MVAEGETVTCDVVVIGAGIIGICAAANLAEAGLSVTVVDRTGVCEETSSGNAAGLAFPEMLPMAHKGMIAHVPKWLADPLGPLAIPPAYFPKVLPWLYRFWRAGAKSRYEASLAAQASLMQLAEPEWAGLATRAGAEDLIHDYGALELYDSEAEFQAALPGWQARDRFGVEYRHLAADEIADYQPGLSERFVRATFMPTWRTVSNPKTFGKAIWDYAASKGANLAIGNVVAVTPGSDRVAVLLEEGGRLEGKHVVVAAGAWSHLVVRELGDRIPLETERGYNTTLPKTAFDLRMQLSFAGHGFVITPLADGVRVGGAVELGGLRRKPDYRRAGAMLEKAKRFLPALDISGGRQWMGYRPSLPDTLPVIGTSRNDARIVYAFGHGHLGLTQGAATGRLVRDLVSGKAPAVDLAPFSPQRF